MANAIQDQVTERQLAEALKCADMYVQDADDKIQSLTAGLRALVDLPLQAATLLEMIEDISSDLMNHVNVEAERCGCNFKSPR